MHRIVYLVGFILTAQAAAANANEDGVRAHVRKGQRLWTQSCRLSTPDGACITTVPTGGGDRCATQPLPLAVAVARNDNKATRAQQHFVQAITLWNRLEDERRTEGVREAIAVARFHIAEREYEAYLAIEFPTDLDFDGDTAESGRRMREWMDTMNRGLREALDAYLEVARVGATPWRVASLARIGQVYRHFVEVLLTAEIPASVRTGDYADDKIDAYCDALEDIASPMGERAVESFEHCVEDADKTGGADDWKKRCEQEQLRALTYAPTVRT